jgi:hypothetical protein
MKSLTNQIEDTPLFIIIDINKKISWAERVKIYKNLKRKETDDKVCFSIWKIRRIILNTLV